ncbi:MAG: ATP synthase F0 subunit C [Verrucomicrobiota bacterium]
MFLAEAVAGINISGMQLAVALVGFAAALGIGMIGSRGAEAIGRNPGAFNLILIFGLLAMAFAEGLAILVYFVVNK